MDCFSEGRMNLTQEQISFYEENGYLHLKKVFSAEVCDNLIKEAHDFAKDHITVYLQMHKLPHSQLLHTGETLCKIGDTLVKSRVIPIGSIFFFCKPNNPLENGSTWHQDNYAAKSTWGSYINLAVSLDDADASNGSLWVIPKSHKLGDLPCDPKANFAYDENGRMYNSAPIGNNCQVPENLQKIQLEYSKGDVLAIHGHLVHKAEKNIHPERWRRTSYFVYIKDGEPFWPGWTAKRELLDRFDSSLFY